ncbi:hypothetical protein QUA09_31880, partial [Microcoleus sp. SVA1B1]
TRTIRVPIVLADITLQYARQLDQGIEPRDTAKKTDDSVDDRVDVISIEPRDTSKLEAEIEMLRQQLTEALEENEALKTDITDKALAIKNLFPMTKKVTVRQVEAILRSTPTHPSGN